MLCYAVLVNVTHLARCTCGHSLAQHHPVQLGNRCRACVECQRFTAAAEPAVRYRYYLPSFVNPTGPVRYDRH